MASKMDRGTKVRATPPPRGPALARPVVGALLLSLSGVACGDDDGTGTDAATSEQPPMPNPTDTAPMVLPTSDDGTIPPMLPPMPDPSETEGSTTGPGDESGEGTTGTGDSGDSGDSGSSSGNIPPMPPPTTGD